MRIKLALVYVLATSPGVLSVAGEAQTSSESLCTRAKAKSEILASTIALELIGDFPRPVVGRAIAIWNQCHELGFDIPAFAIGTRGDRKIYLRHLEQSREKVGRCGWYVPKVITVFTESVAHRGDPVSCGSLALNLAHELGHALGLDHAPSDVRCGRHLMATITQTNSYNRKIDGETCAAVAKLWSQAQGGRDSAF